MSKTTFTTSKSEFLQRLRAIAPAIVSNIQHRMKKNPNKVHSLEELPVPLLENVGGYDSSMFLNNIRARLERVTISPDRGQIK